MKIFLTGGTGFVGKTLIKKIIDKGYNILLLSSNYKKAKSLENKYKNISFISANNSHEDIIEKVKSFKPDVTIHLAALVSASDDFNIAQKLVDINLSYLVKVLDVIKYSPPKLFINTGTFAEYYKNDNNLNPAYLYAATKTASKYIVKYYSNAYDFNYINVIPYSIYGPNDTQKKLIDYLIESANIEIDFTKGEQILDFIHVEDVAKAYLSLSENYSKLKTGENFYLGTGVGTSILELSKIIENKLNKTLNINWGGKNYRKRDVMKAIAPVDKNNNKIPWKAEIELEIGIQDLCANLK